MLGGELFAARPELAGITVLLVAGVQYLLLRGRKIRIFGPFDLQSDAGWAALKGSIRSLAQQLLTTPQAR